MAKTATVATPVYDRYPFDISALARLLIVGALTGALGWLLYLGITHYFVIPVFCRSAETFSICNNGGTIAWVLAYVIAMAAMVVVLARMTVYRPLLIALAALAALWGANTWLGGLEWYVGMGWSAILFALATALFGWVARIPQFLIALIVTIVMIVISRLILLAA